MTVCLSVPQIKPSSTWDLASHGMVSPSSMVVVDGFFVIADQFTHKLYWLDCNGKLVRTVGEKGSGENQFLYPTGICRDDENTLWVTDRWNHRIKRVTSNGTPLFEFGEYGKNHGQFSEPWGICFANNVILVADRNNHRIQIFDKNGQFVRCFGLSGPGQQYYEGKEFKNGFVFESWRRESNRFNTTETCFFKDDYKIGTLEYPLNVAVSPQENIFVADSGNDRIQRFSFEGNLLESYSSTMIDLEFLSYPVCGANGVWAVASETGNRIHIFNKDAQLTACLTYPNGKLNYIYMVDNDIWVLDNWNAKMHRFLWK